jgi:signal transduction histidine kinase
MNILRLQNRVSFYVFSQKQLLFLSLLISFTFFSQQKKTDSLTTLLKEYKKTKQIDLPKKAFLLAEEIKGDSLIKSTYIGFGMRSYFNKDLENMALTSKKLHQFYNRTKDTAALAKHYYYKGLFFKLQYKPDSTFYYYNESKNISIQLKDSLEATRRLLSMAALQYDERDYLGSENSIIEGLRFVEPRIKNLGFEKSPNEVFFTGLLYERLGNVLFMTERQEEARKMYLKFFELQKKSPQLKIKYEKARFYNHIANTYESEKNHKKAIEFFQKSLAIDSLEFNSLYRFESALGGFSYNNFKLGNKKLALKGYLEVLKSREKRNYKRGLVFSHSLLGEFYDANNEIKKAIFHTKKGLEKSKEINLSEQTLTLLFRLSKLVKGEKGRLFLEEYALLNDSLFKRERSLKNQFAKVRYETEKKDIENATLKEENSKKQLEIESEEQQKIIGWLISGASILFIAIGLLVVSNRRKKLLFDAKLQQIEIREKERQEIAKSLHDEVAGDIRVLHKKLTQNNLIEESKELDRVKENIRTLSHQLSSVSFDKVSFKNQIINLVSDYFDSGFLIKVKGISSVQWKEVNGSIQRMLYLFIRESIQNIDKHAKAKYVTLNFKEDKKSIFLTLIDDGKGFNIETKKKGIGLKNMKERVEEINGIFSLKSEIEKGTTINIEIPKNGR